MADILRGNMRPSARAVPLQQRVRVLLVSALASSSVLLTLFVPPPVSVTAAGPVQMQVRAGFDGLGKVGGWVPVEVELRNDGADLSGEIQIQVQETTSNRGTYTRPPTIYSVPVVLPRKSHKRLSIDVMLPSSSIKTQARLLEGTSIVVEQDVLLTRVAPGDLICGVLSRASDALDFLPSLELPPPLRRARVAHIDVSDIPSRPQLLASLDCLILSNLSTVGMLDRQKEALSTWVESGGLLVVAGGPSWQRTVAALPPGLLPVKLSGLTSVQRLDSVAEFLNTDLNDSGPWLASLASVQDGTVLAEEDGIPLFVAARRGAGTVFYLALDPIGEPLRSWPGSVSLWRFMLSHVAGGVGLSTASSSPFASWGRTPRNALIDVSNINPPQPWGIAAVLLIYVLLVGPGNYLLIRRYQRPAWTLVTVPALTGLAMIAGFAVASANRDSDVILNQVSLMRANQGGETAHSRTYTSLLARHPGYYDIVATETSLLTSLFYPFPRDPVTEASSGAAKVLQGARPALVDMYLQAGSLGTASVDSMVRFSGPLETTLFADQQAINGTITNRLGQSLSDVSLILDYQVARIGDINVGESKEISIPLGRALSAGYGPPTSFASLLYPSSPKPRLVPPDATRRDVLDSLLGAGFNFSRLEVNGLALVGWLESSQSPMYVQGGRATTVDGALYMTTLPVQLRRGFEGEIPAQLVAKRQLGANTASRQQFGTYDLAAGESIALQFSLPTANGRMLMDRLYLNVDGRFRGTGPANGSMGEVSLFNWRTSEWEDWTVGFGTTEFLQPWRFISGAGDVRLRYTFRASPDFRTTGISFTRFDVTALGLVR